MWKYGIRQVSQLFFDICNNSVLFDAFASLGPVSPQDYSRDTVNVSNKNVCVKVTVHFHRVSLTVPKSTDIVRRLF